MYMELIARLNTYRPRLSIGGELEGSTINSKEQALKVGELSGRKAEQASVVIENTASSTLVSLEGIYSQDQL